MINVRLHTDFTEEKIKEAILDAIAKKLSSVFKQSIPAIKDRVRDICQSLILQSPTYANLINGPLLGELGVPDITSRIKQIIEIIRDSVNIEFEPIVRRGNNLVGGMKINMVRSDFSDILGIAAASYPTEKGVTIPWLEWLIIQGDLILVIGYDVVVASNPSQQARSRTGLALMERGSGFRIPPAFAGTKENNFITKAFNIQEVSHLLKEILEQEINARLI